MENENISCYSADNGLVPVLTTTPMVAAMAKTARYHWVSRQRKTRPVDSETAAHPRAASCEASKAPPHKDGNR